MQLTMSDVHEATSVCMQRWPTMQDIPDWADLRGIDREVVEVLVSATASRVSNALDFEPEPEGITPGEAEVLGAITQLLVLGVELGAMHRVDAGDLPDPDNITDADDDR